MKSKSLFFIFLMVCLVFFLTGCDSGGGGSSGGSDDNGGFEIGHSFTADSVSIDGTADTSYKFTAEITNNKGGNYKITHSGTTLSEGTWEVTEWADKSKGQPKVIKYQEKKAWNGASLESVSAASHSSNISGGTLEIESVADGGHTAVFGLSND